MAAPPDIQTGPGKGSIQNEDSPPGRDGREGGKDAGSTRSGATGAPEDDASRRPVRTRQPQLRFESSHRTVAFRTIGCKLNQCETAQMQETLLADGYRLVDWDGTADIRVVNTCTVTAKSDRTCRHEIRLAKRLDPECAVVVTGCYAQIDPEAVAAIPGVDLVLGNLDKLRLAEHLVELRSGSEG